MIRLLPKVIAATALVAVAPVLGGWGLRSTGVLDSAILSTGLGVVLSLAVYHLAATRWQRRPDADDVLFGDLMLWGWARRVLLERRLADAVLLLGGGTVHRRGDALRLSLRRRAALLTQLAGDLESRDPYTHGHSGRVARYSSMIAKRMGLPKAELARIRTAAAVHDVGKLETPLAVLHKPGRLTDEEFELIKRHPAEGAQMVSLLEDEALTEIVLHHHERLDGTGYPDRLAGEQIPLGARIIAVADTFDAITSARPYRAAKAHEHALDILQSEAGTQLDPAAVNAFRSAYLARRPFGVWIALTDIAERLLAWLAGDAVGSTARVVAIAAGSVAVGSGAVALQASAQRAVEHAPAAARAAWQATSPPSGPHRSVRATCCRPSGQSPAAQRRPGAGRSGSGLRRGAGALHHQPAVSGAAGGQGGSSAVAGAAASSSGASTGATTPAGGNGVPSLSPGGTPGGGSVPVGVHHSSGSHAITISAGGNGPASASVTAHGGQGGPSIGVQVGVGQGSQGVQVGAGVGQGTSGSSGSSSSGSSSSGSSSSGAGVNVNAGPIHLHLGL